MNNTKSKQSEVVCLSHQCEECGKSLFTASVAEKIIMFTIFISAMFVFCSGLTYLDNMSAKDCFERHYLGGRGTDLEVIKTVDVVCPE